MREFPDCASVPYVDVVCQKKIYRIEGIHCDMKIMEP
jgi:hypothetical protein